MHKRVGFVRWRLFAVQSSCLIVLVLFSGWLALLTTAGVADDADCRSEFISLCDASVPIIEKQARTTKRIGRAFYWDAYVVRALAAAYDMTGKEEYLGACKLWSDRMIEYQNGMVPKDRKSVV